MRLAKINLPNKTVNDENQTTTSSTAERAATLTLLRATEVGATRVRKLLEVFGSAGMTLSASDGTLERVGGLSPETVRSLREAEGDRFGEQQLERAEKLGVRVLLPDDDEYPELLRNIHNPPAALFVIGEKLPTDGRAVAIVGSRNATEAGVEISHQLGAGLAKAKVNVVSGMALGIDGAAHRGALQEGGQTVAVLGCGVDKVYPRQHTKLHGEISRRGTVVSELFLGAGPEARNFPMRNRIITGMSSAVVVVEAGAKSGSLITARYALEENRPLFAVPGHPLSRGHEGVNWLLRSGAGFVRHAGDLLEDLAGPLQLDRFLADQESLALDDLPDDLPPEERRIVEALDRVDGIHADKLADTLNVDASRLGAMLLMLELKGLVQRLPGDRYRRRGKRS
ncbi:DNA-processing protein DprA [bacterium]|nr:DNA-processing protein DprA [bacterium]